MTPNYPSTTPTTSGRIASFHTGAPPVRRLLAFFILAYAFTWVLWIPAGLAARGSLTLPVPPLALVIVGGFGPLAAAVVMAARENGKIGIRTLFRQLDPRRAPKRWFLIPLALVPLHLVPVAGYLAGGGTPPSSQALVGILLTFPVQVLLVAVMGGGLDEEMGWRGYALPKLLHITGPVTASIVLGMLWAPWHLPLWLDPTSSQAAYPFTVYLVKTVSLSVLIGWMYCASHGNLMVAIWAHALANSADGIRYQILGPDKGDPVHQLTVMVVLTAAAVVVGMATRGRLGADHLTNTHVHGPEPITAECRNPSNNPSTS